MAEVPGPRGYGLFPSFPALHTDSHQMHNSGQQALYTAHSRRFYPSQKQSRQGQALTETFQKYEILTLLQPKG